VTYIYSKLQILERKSLTFLRLNNNRTEAQLYLSVLTPLLAFTHAIASPISVGSHALIILLKTSL